MSHQVDIRSLLVGCCSASESAWNVFFDLFHPLIVGTVRKLISYDEDDIVQSVYCKLIEEDYRLLRQFRGESFFELLAYIRQIAYNITANHRRSASSEQSRIQNIEDFVDILSSDQSPESAYLQREVSQEIMSAVMALDLKYREALFLLIEGYKHKDIADILGVTIDTASTRIRRAKAKLEEKLGELVRK